MVKAVPALAQLFAAPAAQAAAKGEASPPSAAAVPDSQGSSPAVDGASLQLEALHLLLLLLPLPLPQVWHMQPRMHAHCLSLALAWVLYAKQLSSSHINHQGAKIPDVLS